jgi:magnesium transporter
MNTSIISVGKTATVAEAIGRIRTANINEDFPTVFVVDDSGRYVGDVRIRQLLMRPEQTRIESLIDTNTRFVRVDTGKEEVRNLFSKHDLISMPVLDHNNQLVGRITADRVNGKRKRKE